MGKITYDKQDGDTFGGADVTEIKTIVNSNDDSLINISKVIPFVARNKAYISDDGSFVTFAGSSILAFSAIEGDVFHLDSSFGSWGAAARKAYAFYKDLPISSENYISGGDTIAGGFVFKGDLVAPAETKYIAITQATYKNDLSKYDNYSYSPNTSIADSKLNLKLNAFYGKNPQRVNIESSELSPISGNGVEGNGIELVDGYSATATNTTYGDTSEITNDSGDFQVGEFAKILAGTVAGAYDVGFWINTENLTNVVLNIFGTTYNYDSITREGYADADTFYLTQVYKVIGDWSFIVGRKYAGLSAIATTIELVSGILSSIKIANFSIIEIYGDERINSDIIYRSNGELSNSSLNKNSILFTGDSQLNAYQTFATAKILGAIPNHNQDGGRAMKYRTGQVAETDLNWLYHWSRMEKITLFDNISTYVFNVSTNDGSGGGTLDSSSIQAVIDNYPTINDDAGTIASKIALFDAMDESTRINTFGYKQTYAAMIRQILEYNPEAKIVLCTIPLSRGVNVTPDDIRANAVPIAQSIRDDIYEIAAWYNAPVIDLYNLVNLTAENAVYYESDGTHWSSDMSIRIGEVVGKKMLELGV